MAPATTTTPAQTAPLEVTVETPQNMEQLMQLLTTVFEPPRLDAYFKKMGPTKETREALLVSFLPSGEDPLTILNVEVNTLGYLYIL